MLSENLQSDRCVALSVAVSDDHVYVLADAFCTESCFGEAGGHGEEVNGTIILAGKDGSHFSVFNIYAVDYQIEEFAIALLYMPTASVASMWKYSSAKSNFLALSSDF